MIFQRLRSSFLPTRQCKNRRSFGSIPYSPSHTPGFILYDDITDITLPIPTRTALREGDGEEGKRDGTPEILRPYFKPRFEDPANANKKSSLLRAVRRPEDIGWALRAFQHQNRRSLMETLCDKQHAAYLADYPEERPMPSVKLLKLSTQSLNSIARTLQEALTKELREEEGEQAMERADADQFNVEGEESVHTDQRSLPEMQRKSGMQCKNVLKHRRRMMRGHKHKKRLKRDRYKSDKK